MDNETVFVKPSCSRLELFLSFLCFLAAQVREEEGRQEQRGSERLQSQTGVAERRGAGAHARHPRQVRDSFSFSHQKVFVVYCCFFCLKRRRRSSVIDGCGSASRLQSNCSLLCDEQLNRETILFIYFFYFFIFFSLLTEDSFLFLLVKVKLVWILSHLPPPPPPHLASCLARTHYCIRISQDIFCFGSKQ